MARNGNGGRSTWWTLGSLKQYLDQGNKDHCQVHRAERRERDYARRGINRQLQGLSNGIRESQRREVLYLTRVDYEAHHRELGDRIDAQHRELGDRIDRQDAVLGDRLDKHEAASNARLKVLEDWKVGVAGRTVAILFIVSLFAGTLGVFIGHIFFG